jgi:hypothetical protein
MYFSFDKELIYQDFPILRSDSDAILHFFSLDMVKTNLFDQALFSVFPDAYESLYQKSFEDKITKGLIIPYRKCNPVIFHLPYRNSYTEKPDEELIRLSLEKFSMAYKEREDFGFIKKIAIQKDSIDEKIINPILNELELPEIIYF